MDPTNKRPDPAAAGGGKAEKAARKSTRGFRVDVRRAEYLQTLYPFDAVEIRECLEGEPVKKAIGLMTWALEKAREGAAEGPRGDRKGLDERDLGDLAVLAS